MSKFKIINLLDNLFLTIASFLIIFAWVNFYIRNLWISFIFGIIFTFAVMVLFQYLFSKKQTKIKLKNENLKNINDSFFAFRILPKSSKIKLLSSCFDEGNTVSQFDDYLLINSSGKISLIIFSTHQERLEQPDLYKILESIENVHHDKIIIICETYNPNIKLKLFSNKEIELVNKEKLYHDYFVKFNQFPPTQNINKEVYKFDFIDFLKAFFIPQKSKSFFICGLILLFSSFILPYNYYYIVVGSMLIMFSIICKLRSKFD